jgi:hypothetical protein
MSLTEIGDKFNSLCTPAKLHMLIAGVHIAMLLTTKNVGGAAGTLLYSIIVAWCLDKLCINNLTWLSWIIVALPFILLIVGVILVTVLFARGTRNGTPADKTLALVAPEDSVNKEHFSSIPESSNGFGKQ